MSVLYLTGGSRGIGAAIAKAFAYKGWSVAFCYRDSEAQALELEAQLQQRGVGAIAIRADVSASAQAQDFIEKARQALGDPDALVCNAGIALPQAVMTQISDGDWHRVFAANVDGTFFPIRAALPLFLSNHRGSIVTVSSMWGQTGGSCEVAYSATKGAIIAMTRALAKELGPSNIRVNCVAPGVIATDMNAHLSPEELQALAEETPLGRIGTPHEVARCVRFLCGDGAAFVTGQVLAPNGGLVI